MAQQKFEKGTELHQMINDYLRLLQQFWIVEENDSFWDGVMNAIYGFYGKYKEVDNVFSVTMALAFLDVLEEKAKQGKVWNKNSAIKILKIRIDILQKKLDELESDTNGN